MTVERGPRHCGECIDGCAENECCAELFKELWTGILAIDFNCGEDNE